MAGAKASRLYAQVAASIAAKITSGEYPVGRRLPSERELALSFGVSRPTVREAIIALEVDGLVEVRMGSGVHVLAKMPHGGKSAMVGVGPFELLEARRSIEGEACALAAVRATQEDLAELQALLDEMIAAGPDFPRAELADRRFHIRIAAATRNSAMHSAVESLWDARTRSPQSRLLDTKAHDAGVGPPVDEHLAILDALRTGDPAVARDAMRSHLTRVLDALLEATEVYEADQLRAKLEERRRKFLAAE